MAPERVCVGLVGLGTVGSGVVRIFQQNAPRLERHLGFALSLERIADLDPERDRGFSLDRYAVSRDWRDVVDDPQIDVVVELVGGTGVARELVLAALARGKAVVTANKALLAEHGAEIYAAARANGTDVAFEAAVAGTIPVLRALREGLCADHIDALHGIVNGTCNYILSEMESEGEPYEACLKRAQDLGYAEADPKFDVDGTDSAHKLALLIGLALGTLVPLDSIPRRGIAEITPIDMEYARELGLVIKLLAIARDRGEAIEARVEPTLVSGASVLANVRGPTNAVAVHGAFSGPTLYCGAGAGALPTASAVVSDVMDLARSRRRGAPARVPPLGWTELGARPLCDPGALEGEFYLRFSALERPGVLATIAGILAGVGISIASVRQPGRRPGESVPIVMVTHPTRESSLREALVKIEQLPEVAARTQVMRIEREI